MRHFTDSLILAAIVLCCIGAVGEQHVHDRPGAVPRLETPGQTDRTTDQRRWYVGIGATNYHPALRESEAQIDRQLNRVFGWMPCWQRPTTFKDWRDRFILWDITAGVGSDISQKTALMVWFGGASGTIKNREGYGLFATDIRFARTTAFAVPEFYYYPMGKVDYAETSEVRGCERLRAALANTKPYLSVAAGYTFVRAKGDARFKAPVVGTFFRQRQTEDHHMYLISPRLGVEMPVGKNTSFSALAMYLFNGPHHSREYNGPAISFNIRRRL